MVDPKLASAEELDIVRSIALRTWPEAYGSILSGTQLRYMLDLMYSPEALSRQMEQGHVFVLIGNTAEWQGFASYEHGTKDGRTSRLHKLYVLPSAQGKGFGKALLRWVIGKSAEHGSQRLELNVNRFNKALDFYRSEGFRIVYDEVIDIGGDFVMDDHVLALEPLH